jgi:hypothetical protein
MADRAMLQYQAEHDTDVLFRVPPLPEELKAGNACQGKGSNIPQWCNRRRVTLGQLNHPLPSKLLKVTAMVHNERLTRKKGFGGRGRG